jgi:hypothetical protein
MSGMTGPGSRVARLVPWANMCLFSLNLAWMTIWYEGGFHFSWPHPHWPVRILYWPFWMPEPPVVLGHVVWSFALSIPIFLVLLLLARVARAHLFLRAFPGAFAIVGYPFFALRLNGIIFHSPRIPGHEFWLILETVAVLACGVLYYLRRWPLPSATGVLLLLAHFSFWGWMTESYCNLFDRISAYPPEWRLPPLEVVLGVCIIMLFHYGFPAIGFLSALSSGLYLKLSSDRAPRAAGGA